MKVRAKHWVNYNGTWYKGGDEFEADNFNDVKEFASMVEAPEFVSEVFPPDETPKRKRTRKQQ